MTDDEHVPLPGDPDPEVTPEESAPEPAEDPGAAVLPVPRCPFCGLSFSTCSHSTGVRPV